jgi:hypothetical protein
MDKCCICKRIIHLDCESYYWTVCWICKKILCNECVEKDENKIIVKTYECCHDIDVISYGWYVASDCFENVFCNECLNIKKST